MGKLTKSHKEYIEQMCKMWNYFRQPNDDRFTFVDYWRYSDGWRVDESGGGKYCLIHDNFPFVVKMDKDITYCRTLRNEAAWTEWCRWKSIKPRLRKYLAEIYHYHKGLIFQEKLPVHEDCPDEMGCKLAIHLASKIKTSHHWHHVHIGNSIKFFDYDSMRYFN